MVSRYFKELVRSVGYWAIIPGIITAVGLLMPEGVISHATILMLYLISVLLCSLRAGHISVLACAIVNFLFFNYFFTEPRYSLQMDNLSELVSSVVFILFALLAGGVSWQLKKQISLLESQSRFLRAQIKLGQQLQTIEEEPQAVSILAAVAREVFNDAVRFQLLEPETNANPEKVWRVTWVIRDGQIISPDKQAMLTNIRDQVQTTLDRLSVLNELRQAERKNDEDRLRTALLSSVSHDLKTPLVTMIGAASSLRDLGQDIKAEEGQELLDSIISEARRLEDYIQNLLDMTRLGHGTLSLSRQWVSIDEIYHVVIKRITASIPSHSVRLESKANLPSVHVHAALVEQALYNAVDNAIKAGGAASEVLVRVKKSSDYIYIYVCDHGPGIPEEEWQNIFDPFYTFNQGDSYEKGTGLGLSICRSIMRVHGGDARIIQPPANFNHCLLLTLPIEHTEEDPDAED